MNERTRKELCLRHHRHLTKGAVHDFGVCVLVADCFSLMRCRDPLLQPPYRRCVCVSLPLCSPPHSFLFQPRRHRRRRSSSKKANSGRQSTQPIHHKFRVPVCTCLFGKKKFSGDFSFWYIIKTRLTKRVRARGGGREEDRKEGIRRWQACIWYIIDAMPQLQ